MNNANVGIMNRDNDSGLFFISKQFHFYLLIVFFAAKLLFSSQ